MEYVLPGNFGQVSILKEDYRCNADLYGHALQRFRSLSFGDKLFDWSIVPDLAIGRRAYDNWLVLHARAVGAITIDTSRTLLAVHQTTKTGNKEAYLLTITRYFYTF
jgi:hypothetical protein